ncbi:MAG: CsbD family protein [Actinomycetota bacterium]|jgi:uncharacterized protein YjbJ (UPF0337 family)
MPTGSEGAKGRIKEAVGKLTHDPELEMEGEVQRKRDDAELETRGWSQPKSWTPAAQEAEEAEREAERRAAEHHESS